MKMKMLRRIFETIILFLIVIIVFLFYKLPVIIIHFFIYLGKIRLSIIYEDSYKYDPRSWYLQYFDKGFSFLITAFIFLRVKRRKIVVSLLKKSYIAKRDLNLFFCFWIVFFKVFINQKLQLLYFFYILFFYFRYIFIQKKILLYIYWLFLAFLRLIFGKLILWIYSEEELITTDYILKSFIIFFKKNIFLFSFLKYLFLKKTYKVRLDFYLIFLFFFKLFNLFFYYIKLIGETMVYFLLNFVDSARFYLSLWIFKLNKLRYKFKRKPLKKGSKKRIIEKNIYYIFLYNSLFFKNKKRINEHLFYKIFGISKIKILNKNLIFIKGKDFLYWYNLYKLYHSFYFVNLKNIGYRIFYKFKFYYEWLSYKFYITFLVTAKSLFKFFLEFEMQMVFKYEKLDLFWRGDNYFYALLTEQIYIWGEQLDLQLKISDWTLDYFPLKEFLYSMLFKSSIDLFRKRYKFGRKFVIFFDLIFKYDLFFHFKDMSSLKQVINFMYDSSSLALLRNYFIYNFTTNDFQLMIKQILKKRKNRDTKTLELYFEMFDFFVMINTEPEKLDVYNFNEESLYLEKIFNFCFEDDVDYKNKDNTVGREQNIFKLIKEKTLIKKIEIFFTNLSRYENIWMRLKWLKIYGLKVLDIPYSLDKQVINIYNRFYKYNLWNNISTQMRDILNQKQKLNRMLNLSTIFYFNKDMAMYNKFFNMYGFFYPKEKIKGNFKFLKLLTRQLNKKNIFEIYYFMYIFFFKRRIYRFHINLYQMIYLNFISYMKKIKAKLKIK